MQYDIPLQKKPKKESFEQYGDKIFFKKSLLLLFCIFKLCRLNLSIFEPSLFTFFKTKSLKSSVENCFCLDFQKSVFPYLKACECKGGLAPLELHRGAKSFKNYDKWVMRQFWKRWMISFEKTRRCFFSNSFFCDTAHTYREFFNEAELFQVPFLAQCGAARPL